MTLLHVEGLTVDYFTTTRVIHAVRGVSFSVARGERVALVGESGSGKTTTALALMQMIDAPGKITGGRALLEGSDLLALTGDAVRQSRLARVAYIPQGAMNSLNPCCGCASRSWTGWPIMASACRGRLPMPWWPRRSAASGWTRPWRGPIRMNCQGA